MVRNTPPQHCTADEDLSKPQDQGQDVAMADAASDSIPHYGQDPDSHPDQELPSNLEALGPGNQEGQWPELPVNNNSM